MKPATPSTRLNPPVTGPSSRQVRAVRMTGGPRAVQSKKCSSRLTWTKKKRLEMQAKGNSHACLWKSLTHSHHVGTRIYGYTPDMYYVLTLYYHDSCNKRKPIPVQNHVPTQAYGLHDKNAYSDEKEPKRRTIEQGRNEERQKGKIKIKNKIK